MNLFIDTHLNDVILILSENNKIIKEKIIKNEQQNNKIIMPTIKKILGKKDKQIKRTIFILIFFSKTQKILFFYQI